jgi:hypothetical protein
MILEIALPQKIYSPAKNERALTETTAGNVVRYVDILLKSGLSVNANFIYQNEAKSLEGMSMDIRIL